MPLDLVEARRRRDALEHFGYLRRAQASRAEALKLCGLSVATHWRYVAQLKGAGLLAATATDEDLAALIEARPKGLLEALAPEETTGRKGDFEHVLKNDAFREKLLTLYVATIGAGSSNMTRGRHTAKMATALLAFADEPECPPELAARLRRRSFPIALLRFLRHVTPEMENRIRGPRHFQLNGPVSRRDHTLRFPDGTRAEEPAGFTWVFDDMSSNQPFYREVNGQLLFSRQGLYAIDRRSLRWLGKDLIARPRESYRSADILRFCRDLMSLYGKPDQIIFERGVWAARTIKGFDLGQWTSPDVAQSELPEAERAELAEGLAAIGVKVNFTHSPRGKIIEGAFNYLQTNLALKTLEFQNIGRHRGEFETGEKRLRQVRGGQAPGPLGFVEQTTLGQRIDATFAMLNGRRNTREEVPDEIWRRDLARRPLPALERNDLAAFLPEKRAAVIDGGRITVRIDKVPVDFRAPWMLEIGSGFRVWLRWDPEEPNREAAVYSREPKSSPNNFHAWPEGKFIDFVQREIPAPASDVIDARGVERLPLSDFYGYGAFDQGDTVRKKANKTFAREFSALPRPGQPAVTRKDEGRRMKDEARPARRLREFEAGAEEMLDSARPIGGQRMIEAPDQTAELLATDGRRLPVCEEELEAVELL